MINNVHNVKVMTILLPFLFSLQTGVCKAAPYSLQETYSGNHSNSITT